MLVNATLYLKKAHCNSIGKTTQLPLKNLMMASDHKKYLAAAVLSDEKIVTYRLLSRALKVHANLAKE